MKIKADQIITKLMAWCRSGAYDIVIPNFYYGFYEMDLFRLMPSGFIVEYEIKISRSDFKADFQKGNDDYRGNKHKDLHTGKRICNRFFFVVPFQMVMPEDIPAYAGLIYYRDGHLEVVKHAKLLHKRKTELYRELAQRLSFREAIIRQKMRNYKRMYDDLKKQMKNASL